GILIENIEMGELRRAIIGLGVNVFGHPPEFSDASSLQAEFKDSTLLTETHWHRFLNALYPLLQEALRKGLKTELSDIDRKQLLDAINANPRLAKPYADILPSGIAVE